MNHLYARMTKGQPDPVVGMGATLLRWTDRDAATIVAVDQGIVTVQEDRAIIVSGSQYNGTAKYRFEPNPTGVTTSFRFDEAKGWRCVRRNDKGRWVLTPGSGLRIGERNHYYDPEF